MEGTVAGVRIVPPVVEFFDAESDVVHQMTLTVQNLSKSSKSIRFHGPASNVSAIWNWNIVCVVSRIVMSFAFLYMHKVSPSGLYQLFSTNPAVQISTPGGPLRQCDRGSHVRPVTSFTLLLVVHTLCRTLAKLDAGLVTGSVNISDLLRRKWTYMARHFSSPGHTTDDMMAVSRELIAYENMWFVKCHKIHTWFEEK